MPKLATDKFGGCSFTLPDRPTVRQQLEYVAAAAGGMDNQRLERYWDGARALISDWVCDALPDPSMPLDQMTNPTQAQIVLWVGLEVRRYINDLEDLPKN